MAAERNLPVNRKKIVMSSMEEISVEIGDEMIWRDNQIVILCFRLSRLWLLLRAKLHLQRLHSRRHRLKFMYFGQQWRALTVSESAFEMRYESCQTTHIIASSQLGERFQSIRKMWTTEKRCESEWSAKQSTETTLPLRIYGHGDFCRNFLHFFRSSQNCRSYEQREYCKHTKCIK